MSQTGSLLRRVSARSVVRAASTPSLRGRGRDPVISSTSRVPAHVLFAQPEATDLNREYVPLAHFYGTRDEGRHYNWDDLVQRKELDIYERMGVDDQISAALRVKKLARLSTGWDIQAASPDSRDQQICDFVTDAFSAMRGSFDARLEQMMSAIQYGFSVSEKIWTMVDRGPWRGKVIYRDVKPKSPFTFYFRTDPFGNLAEKGLEIKQTWGTNVAQIGDLLPTDKFCVWSYNQPFCDPYGRSDLRPCYRSWFSKDLIIKLFNLHIEKFASPTAMAEVPDNLIDAEIERIQTILDTIQNLTSFTVPEGVNVRYMESRLGGAISFKFQDAIDMHNKFIARAILVPDMLGYSGASAGGSFALGKKQIDVFFLILASLARDIEDAVVGTQIIKPLVDMNFANVDRYPAFRFREPQQDDATKSKIFEVLVNAGSIDPRAGWVRDWFNLPAEALPPPVSAVFTARNELRESRGVLLQSNLCHICRRPVGYDFVTDQRCRVAYHSECLDHAGGCCPDRGGHRDSLLRVRLTNERGQHEAGSWDDAPQPSVSAPRHVEHAETPSWYKQVRLEPTGKRLDAVVESAMAQAQPVFAEMRDKLLGVVRRRDVVWKEKLHALEALTVNTDAFAKLLHGAALTVAGNSGILCAQEVARRASMAAVFAEDDADLADDALTAKVARATFGGKTVDSVFGGIRIDFGGFIDSFFAAKAQALAAGEGDWIKAQARQILASAIRNGDPTVAEAQIAGLFDAYLSRGEKSGGKLVRPARLFRVVDTLGSEAMNEGRRMVYESGHVRPHIVAYAWVSVLDARTSDYCRRLNLKVFRPEVIANKYPPAHLHCRSTIFALFERDDFKLSDVDPTSPAAGVKRTSGFSDEPVGAIVSVIVPLRGEDAGAWQDLVDRAALQLPGLDVSDPPPHVTLLYAAGVPDERVDSLVAACKSIVSAREMHGKMDGLASWINQEGQHVLYVPVDSADMASCAAELRAAAEAHGGALTHPEWKGHATVGYCPEEMAEASLDALAISAPAEWPLTFPAGTAEVSVKKADGWLRMRDDRRASTRPE